MKIDNYKIMLNNFLNFNYSLVFFNISIKILLTNITFKKQRILFELLKIGCVKNGFYIFNNRLCDTIFLIKHEMINNLQ
jgi:hypothetical protein